MRVKRFFDKNGLTGIVEVERNDREHDHTTEDLEDRSYGVYDKQIDALLTSCIMDDLSFRATLKKVCEKYPDREFEKPKNRQALYQKRFRY